MGVSPMGCGLSFPTPPPPALPGAEREALPLPSPPSPRQFLTMPGGSLTTEREIPASGANGA
jgi:hypothetical protein